MGILRRVKIACAIVLIAFAAIIFTGCRKAETNVIQFETTPRNILINLRHCFIERSEACNFFLRYCCCSFSARRGASTTGIISIPQRRRFFCTTGACKRTRSSCSFARREQSEPCIQANRNVCLVGTDGRGRF